MRARKTRGFTLIELIVVLTILASLLMIAAPRYFGVLDKGRIAVQQHNIALIRDAIDKFYGDNGKYPDTLQELVDRRYLREVPVDPVTEAADWITIPPPYIPPSSVAATTPPNRYAGAPAYGQQGGMGAGAGMGPGGLPGAGGASGSVFQSWQGNQPQEVAQDRGSVYDVRSSSDRSEPTSAVAGRTPQADASTSDMAAPQAGGDTRGSRP